MNLIPMADAAYAVNIPPGYGIAAGYLDSPEAFHPWAPADWARFPGYKLPVWVHEPGSDGAAAGREVLAQVRGLGVPAGCIIALDMETRVDSTFVDRFAAELARPGAGFKTWVYGSQAFVGRNPPANGYWVADYTGDSHVIDWLLSQPHVRAVQWASNAGYDSSLVKAWTEGDMWK